MTRNTLAGTELFKLVGKLSSIQMNPLMGKAKKLDKTFSYLCSLSDDAFDNITTFLLELDIYGDKKFKNTEYQLESIIEKYPRLQHYKGILRERVKVGRINAKLAV